MNSDAPEKQSILAYPNVLLRLCARQTRVSLYVTTDHKSACWRNLVAKIDAVQAEYSAFETLHETSGLIDTAKELDVAFVAFSPLGHGWLVDDFPFKTPDDFAPNDFRRTGTSCPFDFAKILLDSGKLTLTTLSSQVPGRKLLQE